MQIDVPGLEEARLADPQDRDKFFRGPIIQGYVWDDRRVKSTQVRACFWSEDMWPWDDRVHGRLITLRWRIDTGDISEIETRRWKWRK